MSLSLTRQGLGTIVVPEVNPIQNVAGSVTDGNLNISVNGINSNDIALPMSAGAKQLVKTGDITQFITLSYSRVTVTKEFDIEYILGYSGFQINRVTVSKGSYTYGSGQYSLGSCILAIDASTAGILIDIPTTSAIKPSLVVRIFGYNTDNIIYSESTAADIGYRLYA